VLGLLALSLLAGTQPEPPRTVNGAVLGTAEDFSTTGPAIICMRELAVEAGAGETVYLGYSGIHNGTLRWQGPQGAIEFKQSESWQPPRGRGRLVGEFGHYSVYRKRDSADLYLAFLAGEEGEMRLDLRIAGGALDGSKRDEPLLKRLLQHSGRSPRCDRTYAYGWGMIMGDESVVSEPGNE
jgi:hypothetical protein